jgi:hypothetical protein
MLGCSTFAVSVHHSASRRKRLARYCRDNGSRRPITGRLASNASGLGNKRFVPEAAIKCFSMPNKRGNPSWGKPITVRLPNLPTEFEIRVSQLGLETNGYATSTALRRWCEHNRNQFYVPEWLLEEWGIKVELNYGGRS